MDEVNIFVDRMWLSDRTFLWR